MRYVLAVVLAVCAVQSAFSLAAECTAESRPHRVPLLELYTAGFVQDARSGDVLQALALSVCS